jgi:DNA-3-methyladenine glycosylase II
MTPEQILKAQQVLQKDPVMAKLILEHQTPVWKISQNLYFDLLESIVSQQLSIKAADTIFKRFLELFTNKIPKPELILELSDPELRSVGLSFQKIKYMRGLSQAKVDKTIDLEALEKLSDEQVIEELIKLKGIGRWTAEMILISSLNRLDVFSIGDLGLRNAVAKLYNVDRDDHSAILAITENWKPYRSLASHYLWRSLNNKN